MAAADGFAPEHADRDEGEDEKRERLRESGLVGESTDHRRADDESCVAEGKGRRE